MELWIRNQDKENIVKVEMLEIIRYKNKYAIVTVFQQRVAYLGIYKTKKRALEILDEIQKILNPMIIFNNCKCTQDVIESIKEAGVCFAANDAHIEQVSTCVYEMPKE